MREAPERMRPVEGAGGVNGDGFVEGTGQIAVDAVFDSVSVATTFRETLSKSGFYTEWKSKFGEEAWALLEEFTGKLA